MGEGGGGSGGRGEGGGGRGRRGKEGRGERMAGEGGASCPRDRSLGLAIIDLKFVGLPMAVTI